MSTCNPTLKVFQPSEALAKIYSRIPRINCLRRCQDSCGPIDCSPVEAGEIREKTGQEVGEFDGDLTCTLLRHGACSIYSMRPLICRLWGVVKEMRCPHGCEPERWLSDTEARELIQATLEVQP